MRLTAREIEILEFIKRHPMISQEELARHFGITRSSVAVHISNLMKKGAIMGKGYVVNEQVSIVVIGRVFLEININGSDNKTDIDLQYTGFALESCKALKGLGLHLKVVSIVGNDDLALNLVEELQSREADIAYLIRHAEKRSSRQVIVNGILTYEEGFTLGDYEEAINQKEWVAINCHWLLIEPAFLDYAAQKWMDKDQERLPFMCTSLMLDSADQIPKAISRFAVAVLGVRDPFEVEKCANDLLDYMEQGYALVSDGETCLLYIDNGSILEFPLLPSQKFNPEKTLPYLLGGMVYGLSSGYNARQAIRMAVGSACSNS